MNKIKWTLIYDAVTSAEKSDRNSKSDLNLKMIRVHFCCSGKRLEIDISDLPENWLKYLGGSSVVYI
jgi:hypothetical protein